MIIHCSHKETMPIDELRPHPKNPNKHSDDQIKRLAQILKYQGWRHPIKISTRSGYITSGHGRLLAARLNEWEEVPVDFQDYEDDAQEYADLVSDNAIAEWADLDFQMINIEVPELGPDFDIDLLGIKDFAIDPSEKEGEGDADAVGALPPVPRTKLGELWLLGEHRLLVGDCTVQENVDRLMEGQKADMVFTDPPYNHAGNDDLVASPVSQAMQKLKDSKWDSDFEINDLVSVIDSVRSENCTVYVCCSHHTLGKLLEWSDASATQGGACVWVKTNPMPSLMKRHWTWDKEFVTYATFGKHVFNFPKEGHAPSCWHIQKNQKNDLHPTMKPVEVPEHAITHSSNPNALIWDGFLGSGTTLIACEKTNRRCFGMEIDPHYCDVILDRWSKYTGKTAKREDGAPWEYIRDGGD